VHDGGNCGFDPSLVRNGDVIFVDAFLLREFFENEFPYIKARFKLLTHCSDAPAPGEYDLALDDERLVQWFAQNRDMSSHPKLTGIPIGLADPRYAHGDPRVVDGVIAQLDNIQRDSWLYVNLDLNTNPDRQRAVEALQRNGFNVKSRRTDFEGSAPSSVNAWRSLLCRYLRDLARHRFVLCPPGNGLDTHRTWEALLMGVRA